MKFIFLITLVLLFPWMELLQQECMCIIQIYM